MPPKNLTRMLNSRVTEAQYAVVAIVAEMDDLDLSAALRTIIDAYGQQLADQDPGVRMLLTQLEAGTASFTSDVEHGE